MPSESHFPHKVTRWCDHVFVRETRLKVTWRHHVKIIHIFCQSWKIHGKDGAVPYHLSSSTDSDPFPHPSSAITPNSLALNMDHQFQSAPGMQLPTECPVVSFLTCPPTLIYKGSYILQPQYPTQPQRAPAQSQYVAS